MILADKIIKHRKLNGWSQEELAERMEVSRQAVSKWESSQSAPDLDKIIKLSEVFGVTTDYLLKDEIETEIETFKDNIEEMPKELKTPIRKISMEEANNYLAIREKASFRIAIATFMCIISPICLFILSALSESKYANISENMAAVIGLIVLLLFVAVAVGMFIFTGFESSEFSFMEKEPFETEYGVSDMVKDKKKSYRNTYIKMNILGVTLCIISPISLFICAVNENELFAVCMLSITLLIAGIGIFILIMSGVIHASMQRLLGDPDYVNYKKFKKEPVKDALSGGYWLTATAIYLGWSFWTGDWHKTWIVWVVAGVLFGAVMAVFDIFDKKDRSK